MPNPASPRPDAAFDSAGIAPRSRILALAKPEAHTLWLS